MFNDSGFDLYTGADHPFLQMGRSQMLLFPQNRAVWGGTGLHQLTKQTRGKPKPGGKKKKVENSMILPHRTERPNGTHPKEPGLKAKVHQLHSEPSSRGSGMTENEIKREKIKNKS